jgi:ATP-dependent phosphofructokinase / diphosphate-dependent phosphofructokinase
MQKNALYAQSGGVTAVINSSFCGLIRQIRDCHADKIPTLFAAKNGIIGALNNDLIDTKQYSDADIAKIMHTPSGVFGSCRYKLRDFKEIAQLIEVFKANNIGYFFYNGGGDSQDTTNKVAEVSAQLGYPITCIGIPKTIDNDLPFTDACPGFGSVAKYVAVSTKEAGLDVAAMAASSTKVFILEVMGRHAGWIAASAALANNNNPTLPPHIILLPEVIFNEEKFLAKVSSCVKAYGYCVIVVSEGLRKPDGGFISDSGVKDAFGHAKLGGVAPVLAQLVSEKLQFKYHYAIADYLQRSARHIASKVDVEQAFALGEAAVKFAMDGLNAIMPIIKREQDWPYKWSISHVPLAGVANQERKMPQDFIGDDGMSISALGYKYLLPLIQGEAYPPYIDGIPDYWF